MTLESIHHKLSMVKLRIKYILYSTLIGHNMPKLLTAIKEKPRVRVFFFVINVGMWKNDGLFKLLMADSRFEPYIVSFIYPDDNESLKIETQNKLKCYFDKKGYPFISSYDGNEHKYVDLKSLCPDIIFYAQPGNVGYSKYLIENMWKHSIFAYSPYCFSLETGRWRHSLLLEDVAWRFFCPTQYHKDFFSKINYNKGSNIIVSGYTMADYLLASPSSKGCWKDPSCKSKIIWAPHHSILPEDHLNYSTFLAIAEPMLRLAEKYKDSIQFAFKPHPRLINKLYKAEGWGKEKTDNYYKAWRDMPNTTLADGDYVDLFLTSSAMIHDCSSFTAEYLYTRKPVMYITKDEHISNLNDFGVMCFNAHYKGSSIQDIENFITNIVVDGNDSMVLQREGIFEKMLKSPGSRTTAENMYLEFVKLIEG